MALSRKVVLNVLLSVQLYYCGYGILCPFTLCGNIFVYSLGGLYVLWVICTYAYNLAINETSNTLLRNIKGKYNGNHWL